MDFTGIYREQNFYADVPHICVDASDISGTYGYCDAGAASIIRERTAGLPINGIHFLDNGNYHYLSYFWLEKLAEPACLVVFDHHTDMQLPAFGRILSCGSWILDVLEDNSKVRNAVVAGPEANAGIPREIEDRVAVASGSEKDIVAMLPKDLPVYISIDKDVLSEKEVETNWDQGEMSLDVLVSEIEEIAESRKLLGADVCGEPADPVKAEKSGRVNGALLRVLSEALNKN